MLRVAARRLSGHGPSAATKFVARVFNTTPHKVADIAGSDITALSPLIVVCATGAVVCVGYMSRTLLSHPDVYLGERFGRADIVRDNQKHALEHHQHLARRSFTRDVRQEGGEFQTQVFPSINRAAGQSPRHDPDALYKRAVAEAQKLESEFAEKPKTTKKPKKKAAKKVKAVAE